MPLFYCNIKCMYNWLLPDKLNNNSSNIYYTHSLTWLITCGYTFLLMLAKASAVYTSFLYTTCGISSCMISFPSTNLSKRCLSIPGRS